VFLLSTSSTQTQTIKNELQVSPILPSTIIEEILDEAELNTQNIQIPTVSIKKTTNDDISDSIEKTTFDKVTDQRSSIGPFYGHSLGQHLTDDNIRFIAKQEYRSSSNYIPDIENGEFNYQWSEQGLTINIINGNATATFLVQHKTKDNQLLYDSVANKYIERKLIFMPWRISEELVDNNPYQNIYPTFNFSDDNLSKCILKNLKTKANLKNKEHPTRDQMLSLASLSCSNISNLDGIESWNHLLKLNISGTNALDLTPLSKLTNLGHLSLRGDINIDASIFENHPSIKFLSIKKSTVSNLNTLKSIKQLKELKFDNNNITDLSFLNGFDSIDTLSIKNNPIDSKYKIDFSNNIQSLELINVGELSFDKAKWPLYIRSLTIKNNLPHISWFPELNTLSTVNLSNNQLLDISPLLNSPFITSLSINNNKLTHLAGINQLTKLRKLKVNNNELDCNSLVLEQNIKLSCNN